MGKVSVLGSLWFYGRQVDLWALLDPIQTHWCCWLINAVVDAVLKTHTGMWGSVVFSVRQMSLLAWQAPKSSSFITWLFTFCSPLQPPLRNMESIFHGERAALAWAAGDTTLPMDFSIMGPSELREVSKNDQNAAWEQTFWNILQNEEFSRIETFSQTVTFPKHPIRKSYYSLVLCNILGP